MEGWLRKLHTQKVELVGKRQKQVGWVVCVVGWLVGGGREVRVKKGRRGRRVHMCGWRDVSAECVLLQCQRGDDHFFVRVVTLKISSMLVDASLQVILRRIRLTRLGFSQLSAWPSAFS